MRTAFIAIMLISLILPARVHAGDYRVQLGLYRQESAAVDGWLLLKSHFPELLEGRLPELEPLQTEAGTLYRLALIVDDQGTARSMEEALTGAVEPEAQVPEGEGAHRPQLASSGHFTVTAGAVPGRPNTAFVFGRDRVYVGLRADAGRVAITPGLSASSTGDAGPYAGLEFQW